MTYEVYSKKSNNDFNYALDETFRFIQVYNPSEVIFMINESPDNIKNIKEISHTHLLNYLNLNLLLFTFLIHPHFEQTIDFKLDIKENFLKRSSINKTKRIECY